MLKKIIIGFVYLLISSSVSASPAGDVKHVAETMQAMTMAWNKGDLNAFVSYYKNSNTSTYVSSTIIVGYKNIAERYRTHYPDRHAMGKLSVSNLRIQLLSPVYAMVIGNWLLRRTGKHEIGGVFTLLWENTGKGWKIVVDHTS
jgi:ketosteroid isomerase-like protein